MRFDMNGTILISQAAYRLCQVKSTVCELGFSPACYSVTCDRGEFQRDPQWHWNVLHRVEAERGLDATEDLFRPGVFRATLAAGEDLNLTMSAGAAAPAARAWADERKRQSRLPGAGSKHAPAWVRGLELAADQFLVTREDESHASVIAGYPWFTDWGRDTLIALPGLTHDKRRHAFAARCLRTYGAHVSQGMLPNRFPDDGAAPEYNTIDGHPVVFRRAPRLLPSERR